MTGSEDLLRKELKRVWIPAGILALLPMALGPFVDLGGGIVGDLIAGFPVVAPLAAALLGTILSRKLRLARMDGQDERAEWLVAYLVRLGLAFVLGCWLWYGFSSIIHFPSEWQSDPFVGAVQVTTTFAIAALLGRAVSPFFGLVIAGLTVFLFPTEDIFSAQTWLLVILAATSVALVATFFRVGDRWKKLAGIAAVLVVAAPVLPILSHTVAEEFTGSAWDYTHDVNGHAMVFSTEDAPKGKVWVRMYEGPLSPEEKPIGKVLVSKLFPLGTMPIWTFGGQSSWVYLTQRKWYARETKLLRWNPMSDRIETLASFPARATILTSFIHYVRLSRLQPEVSGSALAISVSPEQDKAVLISYSLTATSWYALPYAADSCGCAKEEAQNPPPEIFDVHALDFRSGRSALCLARELNLRSIVPGWQKNKAVLFDSAGMIAIDFPSFDVRRFAYPKEVER